MQEVAKAMVCSGNTRGAFSDDEGFETTWEFVHHKVRVMLRKYAPRWVYILCLLGAMLAMTMRFGMDMGFVTLAAALWLEPRDPNEGR